jgi:murein DD-endopeptidase MepM/ murein hydrolase activator NlpD
MTTDEPKEGFFKRIFRNLHYKYKLVVMNESTFEERWSIRLSRMNVLIIYVLLSLFSVAFTIFIIWITPLKEYIPGYASVEKVKQVYYNELKADSLEHQLQQQKLYIDNFNKRILLGEDLFDEDTLIGKAKEGVDYDNIPDVKTEGDSLLREEWENKKNYDIVYTPSQSRGSGISKFVFYTPLHGSIINGFDASKEHYGIDILGRKDETIQSTLDGTVIFAGWTFKYGYIISIQHDDNLISVYKHNSSLLKKDGDKVEAGESIAIIGNTGKLTTGPHLHFELWYHQKPINPANFINFE